MNKLQLSENKALKITNVLIKELTEDDFSSFVKVVEQMDNYIKSKGYKPMGPLIQYSMTRVSEQGEIDVVIKLMRQADNYINHIEQPYKMVSVLSVKNCMYVRYTGPESKIKFAYDKINLTAFEEDISLIGDSYTVFVNQVDDNIIADVFMGRANE